MGREWHFRVNWLWYFFYKNISCLRLLLNFSLIRDCPFFWRIFRNTDLSVKLYIKLSNYTLSKRFKVSTKTVLPSTLKSKDLQISWLTIHYYLLEVFVIWSLLEVIKGLISFKEKIRMLLLLWTKMHWLEKKNLNILEFSLKFMMMTISEKDKKEIKQE